MPEGNPAYFVRGHTERAAEKAADKEAKKVGPSRYRAPRYRMTCKCDEQTGAMAQCLDTGRTVPTADDTRV